MSEFKREERYIVVKLKHLAGLQRASLRNFLRENHLPSINCVVVESDWPEYEPVWQMIERRMTGQPPVTAVEELDAVLHWRDKHTQVIREREALQLRLNAADQRADDLTELLSKALLAIKRTYQAGRDRIVDMGGDCDGVEYMMNSDLTVQEIRTALSPITQPATVEEFSTCLECFGSGTVSVDIMSSKTCNECGGSGKEQPASAKTS